MPDFDTLHRDMTAWRRHLHAYPEFGFGEASTAAFVAKTLRSFGMDEIVEGVGGTGVVATLTRGPTNKAIALRADMDALRITETGACAYHSTNQGLMHACGHDGHTAMLLGAARLLAEDGGFEGAVRFIFQPAEEWGKGALAMLGDGLLERFPFQEIYGLHNMPGNVAGSFSTRPGPLMSAEDNFEITLQGLGGHSSRPHLCKEAMVAGCALVVSLQTVVSQRIDPAQQAVLSVTEFESDGTRNALAGEVVIRGDVRSFEPMVSAEVERQMRVIAQGTAEAYGLKVEVAYTREFIPLLNDPACTEEALAAASAVVGGKQVSVAPTPVTVSEDFAQFLSRVPGCFAFIGNGERSLPLHNPGYDFDDAILLDGARFFAAIARRRLPEGDRR